MSDRRRINTRVRLGARAAVVLSNFKSQFRTTISCSRNDYNSIGGKYKYEMIDPEDQMRCNMLSI